MVDRGSPWLALAAAGAWLACAQACGQGISDMPIVKQRDLVVDCALPPVVRALGAGRVYQTPRKVVKSTAAECEVRGGEYVAFDRADPNTALKIWRDSAEGGDANAQYRVGQIYEMGLTGGPDYAAAASWYRKAVAQGNAPAALNLAVLYEKGLGVPQDRAIALNLYRKAQGLPEELVSSRQVAQLQDQLSQAQQRINRLEAEIRSQRRSGAPTSQKEVELQEARAEVDKLLSARDLPAGMLVDVGERAGAKPTIQLIDPNLVSTRGSADVPIRKDIQSQPVVGRVRAANGIASLTVNDNDVEPDRFGFFETSVQVQSDRTPVHVIAVDRVGQRDEKSITLKYGTIEADAPALKLTLPPGALGSYQALVIGNNAYRDWPTLTTPVDDARAVADLLQRKYAFRVRLLTNATFEQTLNALNDLVKTLGGNDNLLIYYAGHGNFDLGKRGYWIPVDAERDRNTRWILNVQITDLLLKMEARKILVVSDSCYSGAMSAAENGGVATVPDGIPDQTRADVVRQLAGVKTRTILTSGGLQPVWDVALGGHSLFAKAFLDALSANDSILEGYRLYESIEARVISDSRTIREREAKLGRKPALQTDQIPLYAAIEHAGHQGADFVFMPAAH